MLGSDFPKLNVFRVPADGVFDDFDALDGMGEHCTAIGGIAAYQRIAAAVKGLNQRIFWEKAADFGCQLMSLLRRGPIASLTEFKEPKDLLNEGCPLCHRFQSLLGICRRTVNPKEIACPISPHLLQSLLYCQSLLFFTGSPIGLRQIREQLPVELFTKDGIVPFISVDEKTKIINSYLGAVKILLR